MVRCYSAACYNVASDIIRAAWAWLIACDFHAGVTRHTSRVPLTPYQARQYRRGKFRG